MTSSDYWAPTRGELHNLIADWMVDRHGIDRARVTEQAELEDELELDSLELMALVVHLRGRTGIDLDDERIADADTVGGLLSFAERRIAEIESKWS